eukprot:SAG22_NODE_3560_length_1641_cov_1.060960_2_plen_114_part_01
MALREILASIDKELQAKASKDSISGAISQIMSVGDESGRLRREVMARIDKVDAVCTETAAASAGALARVEALETALKSFTVFDKRLQHLEFALAGYPESSKDNPPLAEVQDKAR